MRQGIGRLKIDSIALGEGYINVLGEEKILKAKFALVDSSNGDRYGAGNLEAWSEETLKCFADLIVSMEKDIAAHVFEEKPTPPTTGGTEPEDFTPVDEVPGL